MDIADINISTLNGVHPWRPSAWLRVTGEDAGPFLQGQFTNDLRVPEQGRAVYGLWLSVKGKVLADSFVLRNASESAFWIGSYFSPASGIRKRLESHIIADDVTIEDVTAEWAGMTFLGEGARASLASTGGEGVVFRGRRGMEENAEWVFPALAVEAIRARLRGAREVDALEMERRRIEAGIPAVPVDIGPADLPNEGGLEADAISYTKGCYLGQEVMARLKSMGQVRRRLIRVRGRGTGAPVFPAAIFLGERKVGELRSAVSDGQGGWLGFAMISRIHVKPGAELAFSAGGVPAVYPIDVP